MEKIRAGLRDIPGGGEDGVSGCVQVENTDKKFRERIMNPNGGVDASVNRPFIRFSYPGYLLQGIRSENISMHGGIEARGTTLPPHSPLAPSFVSFPSYTTWRMHIPPVPLASPTLFTKRNPRMTESRRAS